MKIADINKWEKAICLILQIDGWELEWVGDKNLSYDAIGKTPKGHDCVIEMKFRNKYYKEKMLEVYKYEQLISMDSEIVKLYFVSDPKGNYLYWLNYLDMPEPVEMYCPDTTMWTKKRLLKPVYLLSEEQASIINRESYN